MEDVRRTESSIKAGLFSSNSRFKIKVENNLPVSRNIPSIVIMSKKDTSAGSHPRTIINDLHFFL